MSVNKLEMLSALLVLYTFLNDYTSINKTLSKKIISRIGLV